MEVDSTCTPSLYPLNDASPSMPMEDERTTSPCFEPGSNWSSRQYPSANDSKNFKGDGNSYTLSSSHHTLTILLQNALTFDDEVISKSMAEAQPANNHELYQPKLPCIGMASSLFINLGQGKIPPFGLFLSKQNGSRKEWRRSYQRCDTKASFMVDSNGAQQGLTLLWNHSMEVQIIHFIECFITAKVSLLHMNHQFLFTYQYIWLAQSR